MAFAFNLPAALITVLLAPAVLGLLGRWVTRAWSPARALGAVAIVAFAFWAVKEFAWPWSASAEARPFRFEILAAIIGGAASGLVLLNGFARLSRSRPAA
jgi:hypothetical protein